MASVFDWLKEKFRKAQDFTREYRTPYSYVRRKVVPEVKQRVQSFGRTIQREAPKFKIPSARERLPQFIPPVAKKLLVPYEPFKGKQPFKGKESGDFFSGMEKMRENFMDTGRPQISMKDLTPQEKSTVKEQIIWSPQAAGIMKPIGKVAGKIGKQLVKKGIEKIKLPYEPSTARKIYRNIGVSGEAELSRTISGKKLAKLAGKQQKAEDMFRGKYQDRLNQALRGLNKKEKLNVTDILDKNIRPISNKALKAAQKIRTGILDKIGRVAEKSGLGIKTPTGTVPFRLRQNYFPRSYNLTDLQKGTNRQKILQSIVDKGQAKNIAEADKIFQDFIVGNTQRRAGQLEYARVFDMPGYEKDPKKAILQYISSTSKRLTEAKSYGAKDEVAKQLIDRVRVEGGDYKYAQEVFDLIVRNKKYKNPVVDNVMKFNLITKLDLSFLTNLTQINNTQTKAGLFRTLGAVLEFFTTPRRSVRRAIKAGSIEAPIFTGKGEGFNIGKVVSAVLYPFRKSEEFNRIIATGAGSRFTKSLAKKLLKNPKYGYAIRQLKSVGVDVEKIIATGKITPDDILGGAKGVSDVTQFTYSPLAVPPAWKTNIGKLLGQFKSFSFQQTIFVRDEVVKEATKGNILPLVRIVALGVPLAFGAALGRAKLTGREPYEDEKSLDVRKLDYYLKAIGTLPTDLITQAEFLKSTYKNPYATPLKKISRTISSIGGPTIGEIGNVLTGVEDISAKKAINKELGREKRKYDPYLQLKRWGAGSIPLIGENIKNRYFAFKSTSTKTEEEKQRGADYYAIKDKVFEFLTTRQRNVFEATGGDKTPTGWESIAKASLLLSNPEVLQAKTEVQLRMAEKTGESPDPFYLLDVRQQQEALKYQASKLNRDDKKAIINANQWLPEYWNLRSEHFDKVDSNYQGYEGTRKYYKPSEQILALQTQYFGFPEGSDARKAFLDQHPELIDHWDQSQLARNKERAAMGLPAEKETEFSSWGGGKGGGGRGRKAKKPKKISIKVAGGKTSVRAPRKAKGAKEKLVSLRLRAAPRRRKIKRLRVKRME